MHHRLIATAVLAWLGASAAQAASLHDRFDAAGFTARDLGFLETALAAEGDLRGSPDGVWDRDSEAALAAYAGRRFEEPPRRLHAALLAGELAERLAREGWQRRAEPDFGLTLSLPPSLLGAGEIEEGGRRLWSADGGATLLIHRFSAAGARHWHAAAAAAHAGPAAAEQVETEGGLVTRGRLDDGRLFATRSVASDGVWATVFVAVEPTAAATLALIEAGIVPFRPGDAAGSGPGLGPEPGGSLSGAMAAAARLVRALAPPRAPAAVSLPDDAGSQATGTGFFVSGRVLVTADHVVQGCSRVTLKDGTEIDLLAGDPERDVAAFAVPVASEAWFDLGAAEAPRLGQQVQAAGFPYFSIIGTALNLTGGNVSALAGVGDDRRFLAFTAPVQPGNSGGPLIRADGGVAGLVVSRLSEQFIRRPARCPRT